MMNELPLFNGVPAAPIPPPLPIETREERMKQAFAAADERWREAYRDHIIRIASRGDAFTAEMCQMSYKQRANMPMPREWRASGQIFKKLIAAGIIERVGFGWSSNRGVPVPSFRGINAEKF